MSVRIQDLAEGVREDAEAAIEDLEKSGIKAIVTSTTRSTLEQITLWMQGRVKLEAVNVMRKFMGMRLLSESENIKPVTEKDGVNRKSNHQDGKALDVVPLEGTRAVWPKQSDPRWGQIAAIMKRHGFNWGGDWAVFPDYPHYDHRS